MSLPRGDGAARSSVPHGGVTVWWSARCLLWVRSPCDPSRKLFYFSLETMWRHYDDRSSCYRPCWPAWPGVVSGVPGFDAFLAPARHQRVTISGRRCGVWGQQDPQRHARRNGYRHRPLDTRVGTIDVAIRKLRSGTYFPSVVAATAQTQ